MKINKIFILFILLQACSSNTENINARIDARTELAEYEPLVLCSLTFKSEYPMLWFFCIYGTPLTENIPYEVNTCLQDEIYGTRDVRECLKDFISEYIDLSPTQIDCIINNDSREEQGRCLANELYECLEVCARLEETHRNIDCEQREDICIREAYDLFLSCEEHYCSPVDMSEVI